MVQKIYNNKTEDAIIVEDLHKSFKNTPVLSGINFVAKRGNIVALLGPNGAGKTTTIRILSTLLLPDKGQLFINGYDVVKQPDAVQSLIGLTGQFAAVDDYLTGQENLLMIGRLYRLSFKEAKDKADELLLKFDLQNAKDRRAKTYSGGMKRRLDLAMSLMASPPIIFLDEPTTGLDPRSRLAMWQIIKDLADKGTTILLTTQYMDEADNLADEIIVIDEGKIIAQGSSNELKRRVGSDQLELTMTSKDSFELAKKVLKDGLLKTDRENLTINIATEGGVETLKQVLYKFEKEGVKVQNLSLHRPTLDDVFLSLTGHSTEE